jgi:hypothetical protein
MLGNIRFVGELYKHGMISKKVMHRCIDHFMEKAAAEREKANSTSSAGTDTTGTTESGGTTKASATGWYEEDIEALSKLLGTVGEKLDAEAPEEMKKYFAELAVVSRYVQWLCALIASQLVS